VRLAVSTSFRDSRTIEIGGSFCPTIVTREIERFALLNTDPEPTVDKAKSEIVLREDGDGIRDWRLERRWGTKRLVFTVLDRDSPSAMAVQTDFDVVFDSYGDEPCWLIRGPGYEQRLKPGVVDGFVPKKYASWLREQERDGLRLRRFAA
jgi:hypothetical protein